MSDRDQPNNQDADGSTQGETRGQVLSAFSSENPSLDGRDVFDALRELPELSPPADLWPDVRARLSEQTPWYQRAPMALAASVFVAAIAAVVLLQPNEAPQNDWAALVDRSQQLEGQVLGGAVPSTVRFNATQRSLAYRIADVDEQLNTLQAASPSEQPPEQRAVTQRDTEALLRQRVELLEALLAEELARRNAQTF